MFFLRGIFFSRFFDVKVFFVSVILFGFFDLKVIVLRCVGLNFLIFIVARLEFFLRGSMDDIGYLLWELFYLIFRVIVWKGR